MAFLVLWPLLHFGKTLLHTQTKNCSNCLFIKSQRSIGCFSEKPHRWWFTTCSHSSFLGFWKKWSYCSIPCSICSLSSDCHFVLCPEKMLQDRQNTNSLNNPQSILLHTTTLFNTALLESLVKNNLGLRAHSHSKVILKKKKYLGHNYFSPHLLEHFPIPSISAFVA